ncbi:zinc-ribbon domain-containing protein [Pseudoroseomonas cervicalis]|uniref:zinc-ribbon domain-containing protein n=1 Tax=Teichococcus cervicalis TaxID=204525 RepID=UPI0027806B9D|nr:zinc-ribbon domain-containing protein [Pseudoroseomonas cervicalis]MDQ1081572.1 putative Zn finger-like uncharacterized protein [Pseudoroseomonas cervicalis]
MRLQCPDCAAAYEVPESLVAPGRLVRCVRCGHGWVPLPAPPRALPRTEMPPIRPSFGLADKAEPAGEGRAPQRAGAEAAGRQDAAPETARAATPRQQAATGPAAAAAPPAASSPASPSPAAPPPARPSQNLPVPVPTPVSAPPRGAGLAWLLSLLLLAAALGALWHWRGPIAAAWPPMRRLYQLLGG